MKIEFRTKREAERGYALVLTLVFLAITMMLLASIGSRASNGSALTARNNSYNHAVAAAESATEVVIAQMSRDFLHQALSANVNQYNGILPATFVPSGWPADYQFSDGQGNVNLTEVACTGWQQWTNLDSQFAGLYGLVTTYQLTSNAKKIAGAYPVAAGVRQSIQFTSIPIFQYAIFYTLDLEINPGPPMLMTGKVHGNSDMYLAPQDTLEFMDSVGYVGHVYYNRHPSDPTGGGKTIPIFDAQDPQQVSAMTLPVGTDNNPTNVVQILDPPPIGEDPWSAAGRERYYNKSDLIITTTNNSVTVKFNEFEDGSALALVVTNSPTAGGKTGYTFVNTNVLFYDYREGKQVQATEIDVVALTNWLTSGGGYSLNLLAQAKTGHGINSIFVDDQRPDAGKLTAVRVVNGQSLPASGLTVATPRPLYVAGNFNAPDLTPGSTNTSLTAPASLVSDAITILSPNWNDSWDASIGLSSRNAGNATVNAAFLSAIVPSVTTSAGVPHYSGGVENFPRFLENWSSSTLTYNGSMVVMFASRYATNFWIAPGTYYNPPTRKWAFDSNFLSINKLPPATPQVRKTQRGSWSIVAASN